MFLTSNLGYQNSRGFANVLVGMFWLAGFFMSWLIQRIVSIFNAETQRRRDAETQRRRGREGKGRQGKAKQEKLKSNNIQKLIQHKGTKTQRET